ncbi:hypothetical protein GCM10020254_79130 [Streptomyces goshikiensis]
MHTDHFRVASRNSPSAITRPPRRGGSESTVTRAWNQAARSGYRPRSACDWHPSGLRLIFSPSGARALSPSGREPLAAAMAGALRSCGRLRKYRSLTPLGADLLPLAVEVTAVAVSAGPFRVVDDVREVPDVG